MSIFDQSFPEIFGVIIKIMAIVALFIYVLFAFILITQIRMKRKTVTTELGTFLEILAYIHFVLSILLVVLAYIIL